MESPKRLAYTDALGVWTQDRLRYISELEDAFIAAFKQYNEEVDLYHKFNQLSTLSYIKIEISPFANDAGRDRAKRYILAGIKQNCDKLYSEMKAIQHKLETYIEHLDTPPCRQNAKAS